MYRGTSFYLLPFMYTEFIQEFSQYIYLDRSLNFGNKPDMKFQRQNTILLLFAFYFILQRQKIPDVTLIKQKMNTKDNIDIVGQIAQ